MPIAHYINCILVVGTMPEASKVDSFELFRGSIHDVVVITFDELLEKLRIIFDHLA